MFLGGWQARSDYISCVTIAEHEAEPTLSPLAEDRALPGMAGDEETALSDDDSEELPCPSEPVAPLQNQPFAAYDFGLDGADGPSDSSDGPSGSSTADLPLTSPPPLEATNLLRSPTDAAYPVSLAFLPFHPPRAA